MLSEKFREERLRLGLGVNELAALCGVSRHAIGKVERGDSTPGGEVLAAFARAGADVQYVLTGSRATGLIDGTTFGMCEAGLVNAYRQLFPETPAALALRSGLVVQVYNKVILSPLASTDLPAAVREVAEITLASLNDPLDPGHLERMLFRQGAAPGSETREQVSVGQSVGQTGGLTGVSISGSGHRVAGRNFIKVGGKGKDKK